MRNFIKSLRIDKTQPLILCISNGGQSAKNELCEQNQQKCNNEQKCGKPATTHTLNR